MGSAQSAWGIRERGSGARDQGGGGPSGWSAGVPGHLLLGSSVTVALVLDVGCSQHLQVGV